MSKADKMVEELRDVLDEKRQVGLSTDFFRMIRDYTDKAEKAFS